MATTSGFPPTSDELPIELSGSDPRVSQDAESCRAYVGGRWRRFRFHDYHLIYEVPGLYERIFYDVLECSSPRQVRMLIDDALRATGTSPEDLQCLDLGAGNGIMGEELRGLGIRSAVGVDILPEAAAAAARDRPGVYDAYVVGDICDLDRAGRATLENRTFNCLTCVAALGFGDIPPEAFRCAYNMIDDGGLIAFNIKDQFLDGDDPSGFSRLVTRIVADATLDVRRRVRYRHRVSAAGEDLHYVALVGVKRTDIAPL